MQIGTEALYNDAVSSLSRIQQFNAQSLVREDELGRGLSFAEAVQPADLLVALFKRLSPAALSDFPDTVLTTVRDQANATFNLFKEALDFSTEIQNPNQIRQGIINKIKTAYQPAFSALHPYISYSLHRSADFQRLDTEARATLQSIEDNANEFATTMQRYQNDAQRILEEIRSVAAEEGVSQQAFYFREEATDHETKAAEWRVTTTWLASFVIAFAMASLFIHKIPFLAPASLYDTVQIAVSKILIFAVLGYLLVLSARNFLSHKHNAIVNKHRQNALMTHRAIVEAAVESGVRDAIMIQAASCIFSPQGTGYSGAGADNELTSQKSVIEIMSKSISDASPKSG